MMNALRVSCTAWLIATGVAAPSALAQAQPGERPVNPNPKQPAPEPKQPGADDKDPGAKPFSVAGLTFNAPTAFDKKDVPEAQRQMRAAQFVVPAPDDSNLEDGEIVFFYFGPQGAGNVESNIQRWSGQVLDAAGKPAEPALRVVECGALKTTEATFTGTYQSGMPGADKTPRPGYTLIGAIIEGGPKGQVVARFTGPEGVVKAQRAQWERLLASVRADAK